MRRTTLGLAAALIALTASSAQALTPPIPGLPTGAQPAPFSGHAAVPRPVWAPAVPQDPFLSANPGNSMHNDAYASDAYPQQGPLGRSLRVNTASYGVSECATIAFDSRGRLIGLCGGLQGFDLKRIDPVTLEQQADLQMPLRQVDPTSGTTPLNDLCGGAYFYLDRQDRSWALTTTKEVWRIAETPSGFVKQRGYPLGGSMPSTDCPIAVLPDWRGRVWFVTRKGRVGTLNAATGAVRVRALPGETIANSFAIDPSGGVFIVSDHAMYRFVAGRGGRPLISWRRAYDRGHEQKPGQLSQGSGTTPTLIGRDLLAITDNADPRMHVIVYNRNTARRICSVPVFRAGQSDTENSLAAAGRSVIVENNYGYQGPQSTIGGRTTAPGVARVVIGAHDCRVAWTNPTSAPTSVPKVSLGAGLVYVYAKDGRSDGRDLWGLRAISIATGRTVWTQTTGEGVQWNNHYAAIYFGPRHTAYMPTLAGLIRFHDGA